MNELQLGDLDWLQGKQLGSGQDGEPLYAQLLPRPMIELNLEIALHHPQLQEALNAGLREDAYDISTFFGIVFAYCGIMLDSTNSEHGYVVGELCEQGLRALVNKRSGVDISVNTMPSAEMLVRSLHDLHEEHEKQEVASKEIIVN